MLNSVILESFAVIAIFTVDIGNVSIVHCEFF